MTDSQLRLLIGQRLAVGFDGTAIPDEFAQLVRDCKVGNVILFRRNIESFEQIRELNGQLRELVIAQTGLEPYLMLDEECGSVSRLCQIGTTTPCAMAIGATGKVDNAYEVARIIGQELRSTGFNLNLFPLNVIHASIFTRKSIIPFLLLQTGLGLCMSSEAVSC